MSIQTELIAAKITAEAIRQIVKFIAPTLGINLKFLDPVSTEKVDERLKKIEDARSNMVEALQAIDDLKTLAEENRRDLSALEQAIQKAQAQKVDADAQLEAIKKIAELDGGAVRRALGMPTKLEIWIDRLIAFVIGIAASVAAAFLWERFIKFWFGWA